MKSAAWLITSSLVSAFLIGCAPPIKVSSVGGGTGPFDANGNWTLTLPVVFLSNGTNLFTYSGPLLGNTVTGTLVTSTGSFNGRWVPATFYPNSLGQLTVFPGGNTVLDLYYVITL